MKKILTILVILALVGTATAEQSNVGSVGAQFLKIGVGSRYQGMGEASVATSNDVYAMYWNPAGIAKLNDIEATFSNAKWIADLSFNYVGLVVPFGSLGSVGVSATFLTMDQIERTTINSPDGTGEFFDAGSYAVGLSYARNLTDRFAIGMTGKYINERMYHSSSHGFALDVGALYNTGFHGLNLGFSISNYGTKMKLDGFDLQVQHDIDPSIYGNVENINARLMTDKFDLPLLLRAGISMDILKGRHNSNFILSADALHPSDDVEYVNLGGEFVFNDMFSLRGGYKQLFAKDSEQGLNLGVGLRFGISGGTSFGFDYSYIDFGVLNVIHMYSATLGI